MFQRILYLIIVVILTTTPLVAEADNKKTEEQRRRLEQYKKELENAKREVDNLKREKNTASKQVAALDRELRMRGDYIREVEDERDAVVDDIMRADTLIDSLNRVLEYNRAIYAEAVRIAHRNYRQHSGTNYLLSSDNITEAARRMAQMQHIAESRRALADTIRLQTVLLDEQRALLSVRSHELDSISGVLDAEQSKLSATRNEAKKTFDKLSKREKEAINEQRRQQKLHDEAVKELQKMLKGNTVGAGFSRNTKGLNLPVDGGTLTEAGFGATITGKKGAAVKTIHEGIVQEIQYKANTNRYTIFLGYNEYLVTYTNLSSVSVKKGDIVKKDQKIGVIGNGINANDAPYVRLAIYDCETKKPLIVSDFFKKM